MVGFHSVTADMRNKGCVRVCCGVRVHVRVWRCDSAEDTGRYERRCLSRQEGKKDDDDQFSVDKDWQHQSG